MSQPCLIIKETLFLFHCQVSPSSVLHLRAPLWASNACCPQCPCGLIRELCLSAGCLSCKPSAHLESNGARLRRIADFKKEKKRKSDGNINLASSENSTKPEKPKSKCKVQCGCSFKSESALTVFQRILAKYDKFNFRLIQKFKAHRRSLSLQIFSLPNPSFEVNKSSRAVMVRLFSSSSSHAL